MIITYQRERLINSVIYFAKNTKNCGKTKLMKLLYFLDFFYFKQTGKTITGMQYHAWEMGPVPAEFYNELTNMKPDLAKAVALIQYDKFHQIKAKQNFNDEYFTPKQLKLLEKISFIFRDAKADDMVEVTHLKNEPWHKTLKEKGKFQQIDYILAVDGLGDCLCEEDAREIMSEISEMHEIFGTT